jgi:hypothetical protein
MRWYRRPEMTKFDYGIAAATMLTISLGADLLSPESVRGRWLHVWILAAGWFVLMLCAVEIRHRLSRRDRNDPRNGERP